MLRLCCWCRWWLCSFLAGWIWSAGDFVAAGVLLMGIGLAFELFVRKVSNKLDRLVLTVLLGIALVYLWAELAVGIFTHWGS